MNDIDRIFRQLVSNFVGLSPSIAHTPNPRSPGYDLSVTRDPSALGGSEHYSLEVSLAGYAAEDLTVEVDDDVLTITGAAGRGSSDARAPAFGASYVHRGGTDQHAFELKFNLARGVTVWDATLDRGILLVRMVKPVRPQVTVPIALGRSDTPARQFAVDQRTPAPNIDEGNVRAGH